MMPINVSQQLKAPVGSIRNYDVDEIIDIVGSTSRIQGKVELTRTNRSILVKGRSHTEVDVSCSRCLNLFRYPLVLNIEEEYFPVTDVVNGISLPLPDELGCFTIDEHHLLDLTEAVQQYALLAIPMKPLCGQDCAGLCSNCGRNLNQEPCHCPPQQSENSWSELNKLAFISDITKRKETE
ncbi:DUF177 domain-containing protein [Chloroflexota bacterium]